MSRRYYTDDTTTDLAFFERMAELVDDDEWKNKFLSMSRGEFDEGYRFAGGKLIYQRNSSAPKPLLINQQDLIEAIDQCQNFIRRHSYTKTKLEKQKTAENAAFKDQKGWAAVRGNELQKYYIHEFVDCIVAQEHLNKENEAILRRSLFVAHWMQQLKQEVVFSDGMIQEVKFMGLKRAANASKPTPSSLTDHKLASSTLQMTKVV